MAETALDRVLRAAQTLELAGPSTAERRKLAAKRFALADGSFPIRNVTDLKKAIRAIGRADSAKRSMVKAHIKRRARALQATDVLPEGW